VSDLSSLFLTWVIAYGLPVLAILMLLAGIGIPIPASLLVIAGGAFSQQGVLDPVAAGITGFLAVITGDFICFYLGKKLKGKISPKLVSKENFDRTVHLFNKFGGGMIILTRSILSALAVPTNLIAGSGDYPVVSYLIFDIIGEFLWIIGYGMLGYLFGAEWETISGFVTNMSGFLVTIIIIVIPGYFLIKGFNKRSVPV
jgi:membrane-associated protein